MWLLEFVSNLVAAPLPFLIAMHDAGARESLRIFTEGVPRTTNKTRLPWQR